MDAFVYAQYSKHGSKQTTNAVYQYDNGRMLHISNIDQNASVQIQYSINGMRNSLISIPTRENGICISKIPGVFLCQSNEIQAYVYITDENSAQTTMHISIPVIARPKPGDFEYTEDDVLNIETILKQLAQAQADLDKLNQDTSKTIAELEDVADKHPYINTQTNTWMYWDVDRDTYVDSKISSVGQTGPQGKPGETGKTGNTGPQGPQGTPGKDFRILSVFTTFAELQSAVTSPEQGDHYDVGPDENGHYRLYMYDVEQAWIDKGIMQGGGTGDGTVITINGKEADEDGDVALCIDNILPSEEEASPVEGYVRIPVVADDAQKFGGKDPSYYLAASGTAVDSAKLCGKPPEAFFAVNLLDNSDFEVAQAGYNEYHGNDLYHADRWFGNGLGTLSVSGSVKTFTSISGFSYMRQTLWNDGRDYGKTYTLVITLPDGTRLVGSGTAPSAPSTSEQVFIDISAPDPRCWFMLMKTEDNALCMRIDASQTGASVSFLHVDLFEGMYTEESAPMHMPKGYAVELAECRNFYKIVNVSIKPVFGDGTTTRTYAIEHGEMRATLNASSIVILSAYERIGWNDTSAAFSVATVYPNNNTVLIYATGNVAAGSECWAMIKLACSADL